MADRKHNVLIFPAGSEIGFEIYNSLRYNLHVSLFGASAKADHAKFVYPAERYFEDDFYINRRDFLSEFNALLQRLGIDLIMPTHDDVVLYLAQHQSKLFSKVVTSPYETTLIARRKTLTFDVFSRYKFCPHTYHAPYDDLEFPVFLKPDIGQGGKGTFYVENPEQLKTWLQSNPALLVCEYLPGEELSVDCFTDRKRELLFVGPRTRERVQMGISFHSASVPLTPEINEIAHSINSALTLRGAWFFQVKRDKGGQWKLLEFAARQSSTMGLYRQAGVNFALLSIFDALDLDVRILKNEYDIVLSRNLQNRYKMSFEFQRVYIDFDDTLVIDGKVNENAMKFLYQCKNRGVFVSLITKHRFDLSESLKAARIAKNLFDEVIVLGEGDHKHAVIQPGGSIFIDNYFFDREAVKTRLNIPVFDVDGIDCLLQD